MIYALAAVAALGLALVSAAAALHTTGTWAGVFAAGVMAGLFTAAACLAAAIDDGQ